MRPYTPALLLLCCCTSTSLADMLVADYANRRVMRFSEEDGSLIDPDFIRFDASDGVPFETARVGNELWITDPVFGQVLRYSLDGESRLGSISGFSGTTFGLVHVPREGAVFVVGGSGSQDSISRVSTSSHAITDTFLVHGAIDVVASGGTLLVSDEDRSLIQRYSFDGDHLGQFVDVRAQTGFVSPYQMVLGADGSLGVGCAGFGAFDFGIASFLADGSLADAWPTSDGIIGIGDLDNGNFLVTLNNGGRAAIFDPGAGTLTPVGPADVLGFFVNRIVIPGPGTLALLSPLLALGGRRR